MFKEIYLRKMITSNFKVNKVIEIDFNDDITEILGDNGVGKSTILDAFVFAFLGTNAEGASNFDAINNNTQYCSVTVLFQDQNYEYHKLERSMSTNGKTKTSRIALNGKQYNISNFNKLFDKDLFLSIVNPDYFLNLSPAKSKAILLDLMDIEEKDVRENMIEKLEVLLPKDDELSSDKAAEFKSNNNSKVKKIEKEVLLLNREIEQLQSKLLNLEIKSFQLMNSEYNFVNEEMKSLYDNLSNMDFNEFNRKMSYLTSLSNKKNEIDINQEKYTKYLNKLKDNIINAAELEDKINMLKEENKALTNYIDSELDLIGKRLSGLFKDINIKVKDENDKFKFETFYKNNNTVVSSKSEIIRFGIELSSILSFQSKLKLPIFIDNAESLVTLTNDNMPEDTQIISLAVSRGLDLSVVEYDLVKNLNTLETLPRKNINKTLIYRLFDEDVVVF